MTFPGLVKANNLSDVADKEKTWNNLGTGMDVKGIPDTNYRYASLILYGDGVNGSTVITDNSFLSKTVTTAGNAQISTAQSKFGGASIAFDGNGDYLTVTNSETDADFDFGALDFTVEGWVRRNTTTGAMSLAAKRPAFSATGWLVSDIDFSAHIGGVWRQNAISVTAPAQNIWTHIALTRSGNNFRLFHNGVQVGSTYTQSGVLQQLTTQPVRVGVIGGIAEGFTNGYIDNLRITKGALYTANFTPPTAASLDPFNLFFVDRVLTVTGRDIFALNQIRNTSPRDFVFIKYLSAPVQPRLNAATQSTASGVALSNALLLKQSPSSIGAYSILNGTLNAQQLKINSVQASSLSSSPFSGSTALFPLSITTMELCNNFRLVPLFSSGTVISPTIGIPIETSEFFLYAKTGQN
jgi:hypothetical protein